MITAMLPIFNTLRIIDLGSMIAKTNIIKATILTIARIILIITISYEEKNVIFVAKKVVALTSIQMMSNRSQKNFKDKTENFVEIKVNITYL